VEVDWGTDPTNALFSPITIIVFPAAIAIAIILLFVVVRAKHKNQANQAKKVIPGTDDWLDQEIAEGSLTIEEKIDEKRAILSRVMEPTTADGLKAAISPVLPGKLWTDGKKKESGQDEEVTHQIDEKTEREVDVFKKKEFCIVCNASLKATTYICPYCETKYCIRCAIALSEQKEACWVCKNPLNFSP
jgi:hypothetical protein